MFKTESTLSMYNVAMKNKSEVIESVKKWIENENYASVVIYGSFTSEQWKNSDVDLFVITFTEELPKPHTSKIEIDGIQFDVTFISTSQFISMVKGQVRSHSFKPQLVDSIIVFDKTNRIAALKEDVSKEASPAKKDLLDFFTVRYSLRDATEGIEKNLKDDPATSLLLMHTSLEILIKFFYRLNEKWQVPAKNTLAELEEWGGDFGKHIKALISENNVEKKFGIWNKLLEMIEDQMKTGNKTLQCDCSKCQENLKSLVK